MPREQVTYLHYISPKQRQLQKTLEDSVVHFKRRLKRIVADAFWHCRRDQLWIRLLTGAASKNRPRNTTGGGFWSASNVVTPSRRFVLGYTDRYRINSAWIRSD